MSIPLTITYNQFFKNDDPFQLHVAIHGQNKQVIVEKLQKMIDEINNSYGKPIQGSVGSYKCQSYVSTPIWDSEGY